MNYIILKFLLITYVEIYCKYNYNNTFYCKKNYDKKTL